MQIKSVPPGFGQWHARRRVRERGDLSRTLIDISAADLDAADVLEGFARTTK